jgi:hypothetical protein
MLALARPELTANQYNDGSVTSALRKGSRAAVDLFCQPLNQPTGIVLDGVGSLFAATTSTTIDS